MGRNPGTGISSVHFVTLMMGRLFGGQSRITQHYNYSDHDAPGPMRLPRHTRYDYRKVIKRLVLVSHESRLETRTA